ncbi:uncharacterized protein LOC115746040 isoform X1 [Rhodamnia argentea]|uniref:Uncharacterized protein LOC115746040 isoform X1 n=1 Tax=Rhodamnia argentea TaxID=178133 RepID=A0A8B8PS48_9MYRT|nr:uncharacterized protein LOC115746040 isoform X1 [Rhodamnia argentea]
MEATSMLLHSKTVPVGLSFDLQRARSRGHFIKRLQCGERTRSFHFDRTGDSSQSSFLCSKVSNVSLSSAKRARTHLSPPLKCSYSGNAAAESRNPITELFKYLSLDAVKEKLLQLTPIDVVKLSGILSISIAVAKWTVRSLLNPFFWMYFSWTWLFWPWIVAIALAIYGLHCLRKHLQGEANIYEQLAVVTSAFTWLTLVPPAHFNGYLEGWPFVFLFVYHYFFFFNISVRRRLYGDYYARPHDPKWDIDPPKWLRLLFCVGVMVGHWLAAFEGPELHRIPGGWSNVGVWVLILITILMHYNSTLYLAKYSEKVVVPTAVVQFGPYRWVRHPIYASTMLLFVTYCIALRAPFSLLFVVAVCLLYYQQKAKLEEAVMVETFGERYLEYAGKVKYKFIPLVY